MNDEPRTIIPSTWAGALVGLLLGLAWVRYGFANTILILVLGAIGYGVAGILRGEIDVIDGLSRLQQRNRPF